ncbi:AAA family ATPase [Candidatus Poribacteria bacterium]|nr:AAA family ATPase [Candidatus Poribacteria bacterium]
MDDSRAGTVTVLFTDIEGSTDEIERLGDDEANALWRTHFELLRKAVEARGGHEPRNLGDGLMVVFDGVRNAVASSVAMQEAVHRHNRRHGEKRRLNVRISLHAGQPIHEGEDYFGMPIVLAKQLCEYAQGGQIMVSETVRDLVSGAQQVRLVDRGLFKFRGFRDEGKVYEVEWRREETPAAFALATLAERTPFIGRESEFDDLRRLLEEAARGHGALVMIGGEPGIGKTRLAEELESEARRRGFLVLTGHCYEEEGAPPYSAIVEILESAARDVEPQVLLEALGEAAPEISRLLPELRQRFPEIPPAADLPPEHAQRCLFNAVCDFLERGGRTQPLLLISEDLQWAMSAGLQLLHHLAPRLHEMSVLIVCTYRDVDLDVAHSLADVLEDLRRRRLAYLTTLKRLPEAGVSAMLRARTASEPPSGFVRHIYHLTEGNPYFVEEMFRDLCEEGKLFDSRGNWRAGLGPKELEVPRSIRWLIGRRLKRVSNECQQALGVAAVVGRSFRFDLLRELVDLDEEALLGAVESAERAQFISSTPVASHAQFTFSHELIRQTLLGSLSFPRRQRMHLRVAEAIERVHSHALKEHAADLAHHLCQAGAAANSLVTVYYLSLAGDRALETTAFENALELYETALSLQPADQARIRAELLYKRGFALRSLRRLPEALDDWNQALSLYEKLGDSDAMGGVCAEMSSQLLGAQRWAEAYQIAQRGLETLGDREIPARCLLLAATGFVLSYLPNAGYAAAHDAFARALEIAEKSGDKKLLGPVIVRKGALHHMYWQGPEEAEAGLQGADLMQAAGDLYGAALALSYAQVGLFRAGLIADAARVWTEMESLANRSGNEDARWFGARIECRREAAVTGDLEQFENHVKSDLESSLNIGIGWIAFNYTVLGLAQFWRGRWEDARRNFQKGVESEIPGMTIGHCVGSLFVFTAYSGDKAAALALFNERRDILPVSGQPNTLDSWSLLDAAIEGLAVLGEWDAASDFYPLALEAIATGNVLRPCYAGLVQTTAGIAAMTARQWEKAEEHFETALRQAHELPFRTEQPEVRRWYARMLIERNGKADRGKARSLLAEAVAMYRQLGMPKHLEMVESLRARRR